MPSASVLLMRIEVVERLFVASGHLDAHRGPPDDPRVKSPAVIKVAWMERNGRSPLR
jgi:hypothetical protein